MTIKIYDKQYEDVSNLQFTDRYITIIDKTGKHKIDLCDFKTGEIKDPFSIVKFNSN